MSGISVTKATYGAGSASVDVTATVASKVKDGVLSFTVSPTALNVDDPAPGQLKQLDITYTVNGGSSNTEHAKDNEAVWIDAPPAREASGLQIVKAEYGYVGNYTDVTDAVQSMVKDGRIDMKVGFKEVGIPDPNPNKVKDLDVSYTINGAPSTGKFKDGQRFKLDAPPKEGRVSGVKDGTTKIMSIFMSGITTLIYTLLSVVSIYTAWQYGEQFLSPWIFGSLALLGAAGSFFVRGEPNFAMAVSAITNIVGLSILTFVIRLFRSSDLITLPPTIPIKTV